MLSHLFRFLRERVLAYCKERLRAVGGRFRGRAPGTGIFPPSLAKTALLAQAAYQRGDRVEAERLCRLLLEQNPDRFDALSLLGMITAQSGRTQEAVDLLARAAGANEDSADARNNLGVALASLKRYEGALESYERAIALKPDYAEAHTNRGAVLAEMKRHEDALESYASAIAFNPASAEAYNNRGLALAELSRHELALDSYARAIALKPGYAKAYVNRGFALADLGRHEAAQKSYELAIASDPGDVQAHWNLALCQLLQGDFKRGWEGYEWRWEHPEFKPNKRNLTQPLWLGKEPLVKKTVLLHAEQGFGDALQFCRYAPMVAARGAPVLLEVQSALKPLLTGLQGVQRVIAKGEALPPFDYHCPLLTLPLAFGTTIDTVPASGPYVRSEPGLVRHWEERLGEHRRPRIGLAWSATALTTYGRDRSIALAEFVKLIPDGVECVSLQKELSEADQAVVRGRTDIAHFGTGFADTAALVELMDVVVTVDTSIAHLAGSMGKPVWVLLPFKGDWRWLLDRDDSPWYPTARLFRQPGTGDWSSVMRRVNGELGRQFGGHRLEPPCAS